MAAHYYSSSKIVKWIRKSVFKIEKPYSLNWNSWDNWYSNLRDKNPIGYFVTETLPKALEWIPKHSIDYVRDADNFIVNLIQGSHVLRSNLRKGHYHSFEKLLLHCMFDAYLNFIEVETAHSRINWSSDEKSKYNLPKWYHKYTNTWRCPEAAIDYLQWEMSLDQPDQNGNNSSNKAQADNAYEKMVLYTWWKEVRPNRVDSWDASGFREFWDQMDAKYGDPFRSKRSKRRSWLFGNRQVLTAAEQRKYEELSELKDKIDQQYEDEDTEMQLRLLKLGKTLWT